MWEFAEGQIVSGTRYRVRGRIGAGGMGSVYEVEHIELGKRFVLKALFRELAKRQDLVARLRQEWRALGQLDHPNIINVTDAGTTDNGVPFYVMERLDGETLADRLRRTPVLPPVEAVNIALGVLEGLAAAHEIGIVHRDVKPPNIFMPHAGGIKLLDFGIAKLANVDVEVITARGMAIGTPRYMSPEQARGDHVDGRADLYAVGLLLFELLTGCGPFDSVQDAPSLLLAHLTTEAPTVLSIKPDIGPELSDVVAALLQKDPASRPASARQVIGILQALGQRWRAVSTDAPTPHARYHAVTLNQGSPASRAQLAGGAPGGTQPLPTPPAQPASAGSGTLVVAPPSEASPRLSTLILGPSGEGTATVDTVRDSGAPASVPTPPPTQPISPAPKAAADATLPGESPLHAPGSAPPSDDRTLAEAEPGPGVPNSNTPPPSDRTAELSQASAAPVGVAEAPTRTSVPLATIVSASPVTPPPTTADAVVVRATAPSRLGLVLAALGAAVVAFLLLAAGGVLLSRGSGQDQDLGAAPQQPAEPVAAPEPGAPPLEPAPEPPAVASAQPEAPVAPPVAPPLAAPATPAPAEKAAVKPAPKLPPPPVTPAAKSEPKPAKPAPAGTFQLPSSGL